MPNAYNVNNPYLPIWYQQQYPYPQMQNQSYSQPQMQNQQHPQNQPIQQSGFIPVQSEQEARSYPVAPGNSVTFKNENAPFCYVKTMGFNQLDRPSFEKYRLVKEEDAPQPEVPARAEASFATKDELAALRDEIDQLKEKLKTKVKKAREEEDYDE